MKILLFNIMVLIINVSIVMKLVFPKTEFIYGILRVLFVLASLPFIMVGYLFEILRIAFATGQGYAEALFENIPRRKNLRKALLIWTNKPQI